MNLTPEEIEEFQYLYEKFFEIRLPDDLVETYAWPLIDIVQVLSQA